jgi:DNA replication protein DnaC
MMNTDITKAAPGPSRNGVEDKMKALLEYTRKLHLGHLRDRLPDLLHEASVNSPSYLDFSLELLRTEQNGRDATDLARRLAQARLPRTCDLDKFDFGHSAGVTKAQLRQMRELVWVDQCFNLILMGPSGVGKTFIAAGLIRDAVLRGMKARLYTMEDLVAILRRKDTSSTGMRAYENLLKVELLAIDDIMLMPLKKEEAIAFFNLVNSLHERTSVIITTNKAPTEWVSVLNDEVLTAALLDRLLYRADVVKLKGGSYRMDNRSSFLSIQKES